MTITAEDCTVLDALISKPLRTAEGVGDDLAALGARRTLELLWSLRERGLTSTEQDAEGRQLWIATSEGGAERDAYGREHPKPKP